MPNSKPEKIRSYPFFSLILIAATFIITVTLSDNIAHSVKSGLSLCSNVIIPSVFPFIVLSDFLYAELDFSRMKFISMSFAKIFKINPAGLYPFVLGMLCGFPLGVKCTAELYLSGTLSRDEAERLIGFCNNTGPAFLVCGIGMGLRGKVADGILLYISMIFSAIMVGIIFSVGRSAFYNDEQFHAMPKFSITASIKNAGASTINICSYLTFFASIVGLLRNALGHNLLYLSIIPFLEVGSASSILSKTELLIPIHSLALTSFAESFSGLSVHLQALSFISDTDIRVNKYFTMKLLQGTFSAVLVLVGARIVCK